MKNQITKGEWVVTKLLRVDEKNRMLYFMATGRQSANPYFAQLCRIGFDGQHFTILIPEMGDDMITLSPSGAYFVDSYSKPDIPPVTVVRNLDKKLSVTLEKTDVSRLKSIGWQPPVPITIKAHDGKTDLYGLLFKPTYLEVGKKYPVIDYIYPGPQGGSVGNW